MCKNWNKIRRPKERKIKNGSKKGDDGIVDDDDVLRKWRSDGSADGAIWKSVVWKKSEVGSIAERKFAKRI